MIIFLHDDKAYLSWVTHHRRGFVLDGRRSLKTRKLEGQSEPPHPTSPARGEGCRPRPAHLVLHRATCGQVKSAPSKRSHFTAGGRLKACSLNTAELQTWANEETGAAPETCKACRPLEEHLDDAGAVHLSRLARGIVDYVLEAVLIHLEHEHPAYHLTVGDVAHCFGKTPGQVSPVLHELVGDGLLVVSGRSAAGAAFAPSRVVFPTVRAMKAIDAFKEATEEAIEAELAKIRPE